MGVMARNRVVSIIIVIFLFPALASSVSASTGSMVTAGSGGVAIIGLPGHQGDTVSFSSLIHNDGDVSGTAFLRLNSSNQTYSGEEMIIEPGSSREVVAQFLLSEIGLIDVYWEVISNDSLVSENLSGLSQISINPPQELGVEIIDSDWNSADGLTVSFRTILGEGRNRLASIEVTGYSGSNSQLLQSFESQLNPGIRQFTLSLGSPSISSLSIRAIPQGWVSSGESFDEITVSSPIISGLVEIISVTPNTPTAGDTVSIDVQISNSGTDTINSGSVRLISSSTGIVLADLPSSSIQTSGEMLLTFTVQSWPVGNPVDIRAEWYTDVLISDYDSSIISNNVVPNSGAELPWVTIGVGGIIGLLLAIAMRSASKGSKKSTSLKASKKYEKSKKESDESDEKREVNCPQCNRGLLIPKSYSGRARCAPPCSTEFLVDPENEDDGEVNVEDIEIDDEVVPKENTKLDNLISKSKDDLLECPSCGQMLKVPLSKRPATARCPACRSEFEALEG